MPQFPSTAGVILLLIACGIGGYYWRKQHQAPRWLLFTLGILGFVAAISGIVTIFS